MKSRICRQCGKEKLLTKFSKKSNGKFGVRSICKECISINNKDYRKRTFKFRRPKIIEQGRRRRKQVPWVYTLYGIRQRCNNPKASGYSSYGGRGIKNKFKNADEIKFLWFRDKAYLMKRPSIDRISSNEDYYLENCRFIELSQNTLRKRKVTKPILQYNLQGDFIREWESTRKASMFYKILPSAISQNLCGRSKSCNNFIWKFKGE